MFLSRGRPAIGRTTLAIFVIVVIVVGGVIGVSFPRSAHSSSTSSATTSSSSTTSSSTLSSSTSTSSSTTSTSSTETVTTSTSTTASPPLFTFDLAAYPSEMLLYPGANFSIYAQIVISPLAGALEPPGQPLETADELVQLNATVPKGLALVFYGSLLNNKVYQELSDDGPFDESIELAAANNTAPGDYTINIAATSGSLTVNLPFTVRVTPYLVITANNQFTPANITIPAGSTVYWLNLDPDPLAVYSVMFSTINVQGPQLGSTPQFEPWSYTFSTPGVYPYYCPDVGGMNGTITVTG